MIPGITQAFTPSHLHIIHTQPSRELQVFGLNLHEQRQSKLAAVELHRTKVWSICDFTESRL